MRPLSKHIDDIASEDRIINNDITEFTQTEILHQILLAKNISIVFQYQF